MTSAPTPYDISAEAMRVLHDGIKAELINEAMDWVGDYRTPVWMALVGAANRMGVALTKDDLYTEQAARRAPEGTPPICPNCGNSRQVWRNQITKRWTCHRAHCDTVVEEVNTGNDRPQVRSI